MAESDGAAMRSLLLMLRESGDALEAASPPFGVAAAADRLLEAARADGLLQPGGMPEDDLAVTDPALEEEAPPFDVEAGAARLWKAARARGLLSSGAHSPQSEPESEMMAPEPRVNPERGQPEPVTMGGTPHVKDTMDIAARVLSLAQQTADQAIADARREAEEIIGSALARIDDLRAFEREVRGRLEAYLEGQLHDLEATFPTMSSAPPAPTPGPRGQPEPVTMGGAPMITTNIAARVLSLAQQTADQAIADARREADETLARARRRADELGAFEREYRGRLKAYLEGRLRDLEAGVTAGGTSVPQMQRQIDDLRAFERGHRGRLKAYLEGRLRDLEAGVTAGGTSAPQPQGDRYDFAENQLARLQESLINQLRSSLTRRELQCLKLMVEDMSTASMARELGISSSAVRVHIKNILTKLGAHSRLQATSLAVHHGLLDSNHAARLNEQTSMT